MLKVLLAGTGTMGRIHAKAWDAMTDVKLVGICGSNQTKADKFAAEYNTHGFVGLAEALDQVDADVVDICLPTFLHKESVLQAAKLKKHIICEKPLGLQIQDCKEMIKACREASVKLYPAHVLRFFSDYVELREKAKSGRLGCIHFVRLSRGGPYPYGANDWYSDRNRSGGPLLDLIIHDYDWACWLLGEAVSVKATETVAAAGEGHHAHVMIQFASGAVASIEGSWGLYGNHGTSVEISGDQGVLVHTTRKSESYASSVEKSVALPETNPLDDPYYLQLEHFKNCLLQGTEPIVTAEDGMKAVEIACAAIQSAQTGTTVHL